MKRALRLLSVFALLQVSFFSVIFPAFPAEKKSWTFCVYLAAANNLNEFSDRDLDEMMKVGSNDNINIIVYLTLQRENEEKVTKCLYIHKGFMEQVGPDMKKDSGDPETLKEALQWALTNYPSDHIAVVLWDHGSGSLNRSQVPSSLRSICYDDDSGNYLTDRDCLEAFSWAQDNQRGGKKFDIIACDACLMAGIEFEYTFASCANYFVASQETIPGDGYEYARVLKPFGRRVVDPREFAKIMVNAYGDEYQSLDDYTLSAIDLNELGPVVDNMNEISRLLMNALHSNNHLQVKNTIYACADKRQCLSFDNGIYLDLYRFYRNLRKKAVNMGLSKNDTKDLRNALKRGKRLLRRCVIANVHSKLYKHAHGLSIYFPKSSHGIHHSYSNLYWTEHTLWFSFLNTLVE